MNPRIARSVALGVAALGLAAAAATATAATSMTTPDGSVGCTWYSTGPYPGEPYGVICQAAAPTFTPPPAPADCAAGWGTAIALRPGSPTAFTCQVGLVPALSAPQPDDVANWRRGGLTLVPPDVGCAPIKAPVQGVRCAQYKVTVNRRTHRKRSVLLHGFSLTARSYSITR